MKHTNLTLSIVAAFGMGLAGTGVAGSDHGHSASSAMSDGATASSGSRSYLSGDATSGTATSGGAVASSDSSSYGSDSHSAYDSQSPDSLNSSASSEQQPGSESFASEGRSGSDALGLNAQASGFGSELELDVDEPSLVFSDGQWYSYNDGEWYALEDGEWRLVAGSDASAFDSAPSSSVSAGVSEFEPGWYAEGPSYEVTLYSTDGVRWYSLEGEELVAWEPVDVIDDPTLWSPTASLGTFGSYGAPTNESGS